MGVDEAIAAEAEAQARCMETGDFAARVSRPSSRSSRPCSRVIEVADSTYLAWPFFTDAHRRLQREVAAWRDAHFKELDEADPAAACRGYVEQLASARWLNYAVPRTYGGALDTLDVRSLCLIRETLGYASGSPSSPSRCRASGSGPISLFGPRCAQGALPAGCRGGYRDRRVRDLGARRRLRRAAMATTARRDGDAIVIDGEKTWISNAGIASLRRCSRAWPEGGERRLHRPRRRRRHARAGRRPSDRRHRAASPRHASRSPAAACPPARRRRAGQGHAGRARHAGPLPHDRRRGRARVRAPGARRGAGARARAGAPSASRSPSSS